MTVGTCSCDHAATAAATSTTVTVVNPSASGDTLELVFASSAPTAGAIACADGTGNTWVIDSDLTRGGRSVVCRASRAHALNPGDTVTITHPAAVGRVVLIEDVGALGDLDRSGGNTGSGTGPYAQLSAARRSAAEQQLAISAVFSATGTGLRWTAPFTADAAHATNQCGAGTRVQLWIATRTTAAPPSGLDMVSATLTAGAGDWTATLISLYQVTTPTTIPAVTATASPMPPVATATATVAWTPSSTPTAAGTATVGATATVTAANTPPTATRTNAPIQTPTSTSTATPARTPTPTPTCTPTPTPVPTPTELIITDPVCFVLLNGACLSPEVFFGW
jgi:hypothetical protein